MGDRLTPSVSQEVPHLLLTGSIYRQLCRHRLLPSPLLPTGISCLSPFRTTLLLSSLPISSPSAFGLLGIRISRKSRKPHSGGLHCGLCPHLLGPREARRGGLAGSVLPALRSHVPKLHWDLAEFHPTALLLLLITFSLNHLVHSHDFCSPETTPELCTKLPERLLHVSRSCQTQRALT